MAHRNAKPVCFLAFICFAKLRKSLRIDKVLNNFISLQKIARSFSYSGGQEYDRCICTSQLNVLFQYVICKYNIINNIIKIKNLTIIANKNI